MCQNSNVKYTYLAFGLIISSELELTEFMPYEGIEKVSIVIGQVPNSIENPIEIYPNYQLSRTEFLLYTRNADFYVKEGRQIIISLHENYDIIRVRAFITAIITGALLLQRGLIPIHGSSVVVNGKAVIFTGHSGAGKTTLCSAFRREQYEFMSDDITAIEIDQEGNPFVYPSFPQQRLCPDTAKWMGYKIKNMQLRNTEKKYFIETHQLFRTEPLPLAAIFEIMPGRTRRVESIFVKGSEKLQRIIKNMYYSIMKKRMGIDSDYFIKLTKLACKIEYYYLIRPLKKDSTEEQMRYVISSVS